MAGQTSYGEKTRKLLLTLVLSAGTVLAAMAACQPEAALSSDNLTPAYFTSGKASQVYSFKSDPRAATTLQIEARSPTISFTAELRNSAGQVVAMLGSGTLAKASLTLPPGGEVYQVTVSADSTEEQQQIALSLGAVQTSGPASAQVGGQSSVALPVSVNYNRPTASVCAISTQDPAGVNVRSGPDLSSSALYVLPPDTPLVADARTASGWYRVNVNGISGWILGDAASLSGLCSGLPAQATASSADSATLGIGGAAMPGVSAPYDQDSYYFGVDQDAGGRFDEVISYPGGDSTDRVLVSVSSFANASAAGTRSFMLALVCQGTGTEFVRWGAPDNPGLRCGEQVSVPFGAAYNVQPLVVMLPGAVGQSYVEYELRAEPVAPPDLNVVAFGLDRDSGGQFADVISYPGGDRSDLVQLSVPNLTADRTASYREYTVSLLCSGAGVEFVRWGRPESPTLPCNTAIAVPLSLAANLQNLVVVLPEGSGQSFVSYTLRAVPAAPDDTGEYLFGLDRDAGGQFNETISYPDGDHGDMIDVTISNLIDHPPNNYREVSLTLYCAGVGAEQVRWGLPGNPTFGCGSTMKMPFIVNANRAPLAVVLPDGAAQSYIQYTLVALPGS